MRALILAIGRLKKGPETELVQRYLKRAAQAGRQIGLRDIEIVEIRESRATDPGKRMIEESIALTSLIPERAAILDVSGRAPRSLMEHTAIYEAVRQGDPQGAAQAMHQHLESVRRDIFVHLLGDAAIDATKKKYTTGELSAGAEQP